MNKNTIPARKDVPESDKWNLSSIFKSIDEWELALKEIPELTEKVLEYKGKLGQSAESLLGALKALEAADLKMETVTTMLPLCTKLMKMIQRQQRETEKP